MLALVGSLCFLAFLVFGVMAIISVLKKNGKAKRNFLISGGLFIFSIILLGSSPSSEEPAETTTAKVENETTVEKPTVTETIPSDVQPIDWESEVKLIAESSGSESKKFDEVTMLAMKYESSEEEIKSFEEHILGEFESGNYLKDTRNHSIMLTNIFKSTVIDRYYDDSKNEPIDNFAFDFLQNVKYVYRGAETVDSEFTKSNEDQMQRMYAQIKGIPINEPTISKAEFDQIKNGMSYEEVTAIIGGPGEVLSETGSEGEQFHTVMYMYEGEGKLGANANMMFQEGKLISKAQFGLE